MEKNWLKSLVLTLFISVFLILVFLFWRERSKPIESMHRLSNLEEMERAGIPEVSAQDIDGRKIQLGDYRGKVLIVHFWASWCEPCIEEIPSLLKLVDEFKGMVKVVAISTDNSNEDIQAFIKSFPSFRNKHIQIVWDSDRTLMKKFSVDRMPESFVVRPDGRLVKKIIGSVHWYNPDSVAFVTDVSKAK